MRTALVWLVLVGIGVGFPAVAWATGRRLESPVAPEDAYGFGHRHGLSIADSALVERATRTGVRVADPALRPLVVERASAMLEQRRAATRRFWRPCRWRGALGTVLILGVVLALTVTLASTWRDDGDPFPLVYGVVYGIALTLVRRRRTHQLERALTRNRDVEEEPAQVAHRTWRRPARRWR